MFVNETTYIPTNTVALYLIVKLIAFFFCIAVLLWFAFNPTNDQRGKGMKKLLAFVAVAFLFAACGSEGDIDETVVWLMQDQPIVRTIDGIEHEIMVVDVTSNEGACGIYVDGEIAWINVYTSAVINGVSIEVLDVDAVDAPQQDQDLCEIAISSG